MTKQQYLDIRDNTQADTMPVLYFFFGLRGGRPLTFGLFVETFSKWLTSRVGIYRLGSIHYKVFSELNKHFEV